MQLIQLEESSHTFPPSELALEEPNGLLAFGGDLSVPRLLAAYQKGIFPWFEEGQPILWWTPDPRTVFYPEQVHCSRSMQKFIRSCPLQVTINTRFDAVVEACSERRQNSSGTWITSQMKRAYGALHARGYAHSIEVIDRDKLVGGIYGVGLGRAFFGESMFSTATNASKMALILLSRFLANQGFLVFDCQVASSHLFSLGAQSISRAVFETILNRATTEPYLSSMQKVWCTASNKVISVDGYLYD